VRFVRERPLLAGAASRVLLGVRAARMRPRALLAGAVLLVGVGVGVGAGGCGGQIAPDLFEVIRSPTGPSSGPGAALALVVADDGTARCNGGPRRALPDPLILESRTLQMDIDPDLLRHARFPEPPGGVYAYRVRDQDGEVSFSDTSPLPAELKRVEGLTLAAAQQACGLAH